MLLSNLTEYLLPHLDKDYIHGVGHNSEAPIWCKLLVDIMPAFQINTTLRRCHFLAQVFHESNFCKTLEENLNYSPEGLLNTWPNRFTPAMAERMGRTDSHAANKEGIANIVYENRMGNTGHRDGYKYRGRGLIQITGRDNYRVCANAINSNIIDDPDLLLEPEWAVKSACWFWDFKKLNLWAAKDDIEGITKIVNGGLNGINERKKILSCLKASLSDI